MKPCLLAVAAALALASAPAAGLAREDHAGALVVSGAWSRPTPPSAPTAVGYLTIANHGAEPDRLTGAESPAASSLTLHSMSMTGGVMRMRPVPEGLAIAPGASVGLDPMGYHLMFEGLKRPLKPGDHIPAVLHFEHAGDARVTFDVGDGPPPHPGGGMGGMDMGGMTMPMH
ncbi:MAG: copper chaperone PCu(A)C [Caulobacteraceae bacterium]|nr:copper chaperone PCu(A)C [Caulobacteraceae bacterium]